MQLSQQFKVQLWLGFVMLSMAHAMVYFLRTAPSVVASDLMVSFDVSAASLGTLSACYFYLYTVMQIPAGILADSLGPRRVVSVACLLGCFGCIAFSLSDSFTSAAISRLALGAGMSTAFVSTLKYCSQWFPRDRFASMSGFVLFFGNAGGLLAASPLAFAMNVMTWRELFFGLGVLAGLQALLIGLFVRNSPQDAGFPAVVDTSEVNHQWGKEVKSVLRSNSIWPLFFSILGAAGPIFAVVGLWLVPLMQDWHGVSREAAASYSTALLVGVAIGSSTSGAISDFLGKRRAMMVFGSSVSTVLWLSLACLPWSSGWTGWLLWFLLGLFQGCAVLSYALAREAFPSRVSGIALGVVNSGLFLGVAIIQPVFGWIMDQTWNGLIVDKVRIYQAIDYQNGLLLCAGFALLSTVAALCSKEQLHHAGKI
ncbi:MAG: sugar phosphate permease [Gammaproteobacteria bacterium]|jgi:sugar phosphate permease